MIKQTITKLKIMAKPAKTISVEKAKEIQKYWMDTRANLIDANLKYKDSSDFYYTLDELQEFLNYVKEQSYLQEVKKPGVRIFFSAYPKTSENKSYANIILVPMREKQGTLEENMDDPVNHEINYDIDPFNSGNAGMPPNRY